MAGFPSRFGTGMSPMGGLQPTNPTPTLPPLQTPAGNVAPPVGAPIPLSTGRRHSRPSHCNRARPN